MTKPAITTRATKGLALDYTELDANFTNLRDATLSVTDGTNSKAFNLNDTVTFTAGTNVTIGVNPTTGAITIGASTGTSTGNIQWSYSGSPSYLNILNAKVNASDTLKITSSGIELDSSGLVTIKNGIGTETGITIAAGNGTPNITGKTFSQYANGATVDFASFSGIIIVTNCGSTGQVMMALCGGGSVTVLGYSGTSTPHKTGSIAGNGSIQGYRWTNDSGATDYFSFFSIKTRAEA